MEDNYNIFSLQDELMSVLESMTIHLDESIITNYFDDSQTQSFLLELKGLLERYPTYYSYTCVYQPNSKDIDRVKLFLGLYNLKLSSWIFTGQLLITR